MSDTTPRGDRAGTGIVVGIDLGATGSRFVARSADTTISQAQVATRDLGTGSCHDRVERIVNLVRSLLPEGGQLIGLGIGASGPVELPSGIIRNNDTLPLFSGFDLKEALRTELGVRVVLDNDAVAAALGEYRFGAGRGHKRLLVVTLGTGIGVSFLDEGQPFRTATGQHPECGHLPVLPGGPRCYCGLVGCWEMLANRGSLEARVRAVTGAGGVAEAERLLANGPSEALQRAFHDYGRAVGRGLESLIIAYDPEVVVLCGSVSRFLPHFNDGLGAELSRAEGFRTSVDIVQSMLGDNAGAIGASMMAEPAEWSRAGSY